MPGMRPTSVGCLSQPPDLLPPMTMRRLAVFSQSAGTVVRSAGIQLGPVRHLPGALPDRPRPCPYLISDRWRPCSLLGPDDPGQVGPDDPGQDVEFIGVEVKVLQVVTGYIDGRRLERSYQGWTCPCARMRSCSS